MVRAGTLPTRTKLGLLKKSVGMPVTRLLLGAVPINLVKVSSTVGTGMGAAGSKGLGKVGLPVKPKRGTGSLRPIAGSRAGKVGKPPNSTKLLFWKPLMVGRPRVFPFLAITSTKTAKVSPVGM